MTLVHYGQRKKKWCRHTRYTVLQTRQDADVVTLFKMKGDSTDPGNYRGIFLQDVEGTVLASEIEEWLIEDVNRRLCK